MVPNSSSVFPGSPPLPLVVGHPGPLATLALGRIVLPFLECLLYGHIEYVDFPFSRTHVASPGFSCELMLYLFLLRRRVSQCGHGGNLSDSGLSGLEPRYRQGGFPLEALGENPFLFQLLEAAVFLGLWPFLHLQRW